MRGSSFPTSPFVDHSSPSDRPEYPGLSRSRVLVLDDDAVMRDLLEALLPLQGYEVLLAGSGEEALTSLRSALPTHAVGVVLSDVQLPGLSGVALLRQLRSALPEDALLLSMSGSAVPKEIAALVDGVLQKPFDADAVEHAIAAAAIQRQNTHVIASTTEPAGDPGNTAGGVSRTPVLNEKIFGSLAAMLPAAKLSELFALTVADITKRHSRMQAAAAAGDLNTLHREAHAVKGSCGMVGAAELQSLATELEGGTTVNTSALDEIPAACVRLRSMLQSKL